MKTKTISLLTILLLLAFGFWACNGDDDDDNNDNVIGDPPTVSIISPEDSSIFDLGETIVFIGSASDTEDEMITDPARLNWNSHIEGDLGNGESLSTELSIGDHTITLTAEDSDGNSASDEISISIIDTSGADTSDCPMSVTDIDGNEYETVAIGTQCWMAENLKTTYYRDGTPITHVTDNTEWSNLDDTETGAYCYHDNDTSNISTYGMLYNWYAVDDAHGLCPDGWHVPTDEEWKTLEIYLGMSESDADSIDFRGTNEGSKLAGNAALWGDDALEDDPEFGNSGFSAFPGGYRDGYGHYSHMTYRAYFWLASEYGSSTAWYRYLRYHSTGVYRYDYNKNHGNSVRCVKD